MPKNKKQIKNFAFVSNCCPMCYAVGKSTKEGNPIFLIKKVPLTED